MNVLVLTSSTGSGHNMRARALEAWVRQERADSWNLKIHEALESTHPLYRAGVETYNIIQRNAPWAHHLYFNALEIGSMHRNPDRIMGSENFTELVRDFRPDLVFSVHGHTNHAFFELARRALPNQPPVCVTYCGEVFGGYGLSRHWVNSGADAFIGAVPEICEAAVRDHSMPESAIHFGGFLLRPDFYERPVTEAQQAIFLRDELGLDPGKFTLLLSTGDAGANNHIAFLNALEKRKLEIQVVALCGRIRETFNMVGSWGKARNRAVRVVPLEYRSDMHRLMSSVSAVVARPGTGATSEAIRCRCPIIHNGLGGIMPQEWLTVKFCRKHGFDFAIRSAPELAERVEQWVQKPEIPAGVRDKMAAVDPATTPKELIPWLDSLVKNQIQHS